MKILHIGDIHLGCTLENFRRNREIENVFRFLTGMVKEEHIEAALLAGDIFDSGNPSLDSQWLYFDFLLGLQNAGCRQIIVIAGNHDSASLLDTTGQLLKRINIHVIGSVDPDHPEKEIIPLGLEGNPAGLVCAVPYLRERDIRKFTPEGESGEEYRNALAAGIAEHYRQVYALAVQQRGTAKIPVIGMGHFYAEGSSFAAGTDTQPVGKLDPVNLEDFASGFDYMALGHIHKPQIVKGHNNWRYAGAILPMNLQENRYAPQVIIADTEDLSNPQTVELPDSCFHKMAVIKGSMNELRDQLKTISLSGNNIWVKPIYTGEEVLPNWAIELRQEFCNTQIQIVSPDVKKRGSGQQADTDSIQKSISLAQLTPEQVFLDYLTKKGGITSEDQRRTLLDLFRQAQAKIAVPENKTETQGKRDFSCLMKFKRLYIKNVNSLYGENRIDFDSPEFRDGIFLIAGNTGTGKTSILDAICLALYGCTPRIAVISDTKDSVMSEGAKEMMAELTFSLGEDEYRACFRHVKLNKRKDGDSAKLYRTPEHKLYKNGVEQTHSRKETGSEIVNLIGMNDKQFTRCVLLAQGNFDAFLKSRPEERSEILKSITGTDIYTKIGQQINLCYTDVRNRYETARKVLEDIQTLSPEELERLRLDLTEASGTREKLEAEIKNCEILENAFQSAEEEEARIQEAVQTLNGALTERDNAAARRIELADAGKAQICQASFEAYHHKRLEIDTVKKNLFLLSCTMPQLEKTLASAQETKKEKDAELVRIMQKQTEMQKFFQEIRILDARIANMQDRVSQAKTDRDNAYRIQQKAEDSYRKAKAIWDDLEKQSEQSETYIKEHAADETLSQKLTNWELRRKLIGEKKKENELEQTSISQMHDDLKSRLAVHHVKAAKIRELSLNLAQYTENMAKEEKHLLELFNGKTRQEIQSAWAAAGKLEAFFQSEVPRKEFLKQGQACPLCGSLSHPYCEGTGVSAQEDYGKTANELKNRLDAIDRTQKDLIARQREKDRVETQIAAEKAKAEAALLQIQSLQDAIAVKEKNWNEAIRKSNAEAKDLSDEIYQAVQVPWTDHNTLPAVIGTRIRAFAAAQATMQKRAEGEKIYESARHAYAAVAEQNRNELESKSRILEELQGSIQTLIQERSGKFGTGSVEEEEKRLAGTIERTKQELNIALENSVRAEEAVRHNKQDQEERQKMLLLHKSELIPLESVWKEKLSESGFQTEDEFMAKRREPQYMQSLSRELQKIEDTVKEKKAALAERRNILNEKQEKIRTGTDRKSNLAEWETKKDALALVFGQIKDMEFKLRKDQEAKTASEKATAEKEELRIIYNNWSFLNDHFGSAGVDRFGRIAQGYTFRELLYFANTNRLEALQRHFTLVCDEDNPLELNVIDHYRGGLIRTSRNLSGGECFEVSLVLALGLADMSAMSQNARLGNVLLDEGFGSLDDHALDSALELLMQLKKQDRVLVGIISHVSRLKEKIRAQIEVVNSGGMGMLSGAGITPYSRT